MVPQAAIRNFVENILDMKFFLLHPVFLFCDDVARKIQKRMRLYKKDGIKKTYDLFILLIKKRLIAF